MIKCLMVNTRTNSWRRSKEQSLKRGRGETVHMMQVTEKKPSKLILVLNFHLSVNISSTHLSALLKCVIKFTSLRWICPAYCWRWSRCSGDGLEGLGRAIRALCLCWRYFVADGCGDDVIGSKALLLYCGGPNSEKCSEVWITSSEVAGDNCSSLLVL